MSLSHVSGLCQETSNGAGVLRCVRMLKNLWDLVGVMPDPLVCLVLC